MATWKLITENGKPVAVEIEGERRELPAEDAQRLTVDLEDMRDVMVNIASTWEEMHDSYKGGAIVSRVEATHSGYKNRNNYFYTADGHRRYIDTWHKPIQAPYILNHDIMSEPMGRVVGAKFVSTGKSTGYQDLDVRIAQKEEVERVLDGRTLTVSTGTSSCDNVECSICHHDLFHDGAVPKVYKLSDMPDKGWMKQLAPGFAGMWGVTNGEYWGVKKDDDDKITAVCHHVRHDQAPLGAERFEDTFWYCHGQRGKELSRVNAPADINEKTGEFAHFRQILKQTDGMDEAARARLIAEEFSRVEAGAVDRARFSVVSEDQLFRPVNANEAMDYVRRVGLDWMFDKGLWIATNAMRQTLSVEDRVKAYWEAGGRFVATSRSLSVSDAMALVPSGFYTWLRASGLSREEQAALDSAYTMNYLRRHRR